MRSKNATMNIIIGFSGQILNLILNFILRKIFVIELGMDNLGVQGLFSNMITVLSLAELGIGSAIVYSLYKPLAEKDEEKIRQIMHLYHKAYTVIAGIVFLLGICLIPFLQVIVKEHGNVPHLKLIYMLYVMNATATYLLSYKRSIIIADQKAYVVNLIDNGFLILTVIVQCIFMILTKSFVVYMMVQIALTVIKNILITIEAHRRYPLLKIKAKEKLPKAEMGLLYKNINALFLYKISSVVITATDNIIISTFLGVRMVGIYSGYSLIIQGVTNLLVQMFNALTASVGNLSLEDDKEKRYFIFNIIELFSFWCYGFCTVCLWQLLNPFITCWLGEEYLLNNGVVALLVLIFYISGMLTSLRVFRNGFGLFRQGKMRPVVESIVNIAVSIVLVQKLGLVGVFLGTIISRLTVTFWLDPHVVFKYALERHTAPYYKRYVVRLGILLGIMGITTGICSFITLTGIWEIALKLVICLIVPNVIYLMIYGRSKEFRYGLKAVLRTFKLEKRLEGLMGKL